MTKITFEDLPSTNTPLSASNLNTLQDNVESAISSPGNIVVDSIRTKNMFGNYTIINGYLFETRMSIRSGASDRLAFIECKPNTTYTISRSVITTSFRVSDYTSIPQMTDSYVDYTVPTVIENNSGTTITYTTSASAKYLIIHYGNVNNDTETNLINTLKTMQVEEGSTASAFSPFQNLTAKENYTTEEIRIGTWIDGKPLYRKVVIIDAINSSGNSKQTSVATSNLKEFVNITGMVANNSGGYKPLNSLYVSGSGIDAQYTFQLYAVNNAIVEVVYGNWWKTNFKKAYVILEYTKTTD